MATQIVVTHKDIGVRLLLTGTYHPNPSNPTTGPDVDSKMIDEDETEPELGTGELAAGAAADQTSADAVLSNRPAGHELPIDHKHASFTQCLTTAIVSEWTELQRERKRASRIRTSVPAKRPRSRDVTNIAHRRCVLSEQKTILFVFCGIGSTCLLVCRGFKRGLILFWSWMISRCR